MTTVVDYFIVKSAKVFHELLIDGKPFEIGESDLLIFETRNVNGESKVIVGRGLCSWQLQLAISMNYIQLNNNSLPLFPPGRCAKEPELQRRERAHPSGGRGGVCAQLAYLVSNNEPSGSFCSCCCRSVSSVKALDKIQSLFYKVSNFPPFYTAAFSVCCLSKQL